MTQYGVLTGAEILKLISENNLVENYTHLPTQVQPAGFDVSLASIKTPGIGLINSPVEFAHAKSIWKDMFVKHDFSSPIETLRPYVFKTKEVFHMPINVSAFVLPRSSLTRLGVIFSGGFVDAGYVGDLSFSVLTSIPIYFKKGQRFAQVIFLKHRKTFSYTGQYQMNIAPKAVD